MTISPSQLHILMHSLGLLVSTVSYRNHFVTGPGSVGYDDCMALVGMGLMTRHDGSDLTGGNYLFLVTRAGATAARKNRLEPEKLTRSQRRYRQWLNADSSIPFGQWIRSHQP